MVRFIIVSALVIVEIMLGVVSSFAVEGRQIEEFTLQTEIKGEIADYDNGQNVLTVIGEGGKIYSVELADQRMIKEFKVGDNIIIKVERGMATSIAKI